MRNRHSRRGRGILNTSFSTVRNGCTSCNNNSNSDSNSNSSNVTLSSNCDNFDGTPTRVYSSCGCVSCLLPYSDVMNCGCGCNSQNNGCSTCGNSNSRSGGCGTCGNSCNTCGGCNSCNNGSNSSAGCTTCGSVNSCGTVNIPIEPVGLPFWYGGYYNDGCYCCNEDTECQSNDASVISKK